MDVDPNASKGGSVDIGSVLNGLVGEIKKLSLNQQQMQTEMERQKLHLLKKRYASASRGSSFSSPNPHVESPEPVYSSPEPVYSDKYAKKEAKKKRYNEDRHRYKTTGEETLYIESIDDADDD